MSASPPSSSSASSPTSSLPLPPPLLHSLTHSLSLLYPTLPLSVLSTSPLLVIGSGGIGCELLKSLILTGFTLITLIDLDTIDVSNLNRQFLFRRHHVGRPKCEVAAEAARRLNPLATIVTHHGNIKEEKFNVDFFSSFSLILNGLDNLPARRHVNRMALAASVPVIESGTMGYLGQTSVIKGGKTECFECHPIPTPKTYAVCTIRNTPELDIHCIVWAKHIYNVLCGPVDEENPMVDVRELMKRESSSSGDNMRSIVEKIATSLFYIEIQKQCEVEERWKSRPKPIPIDVKQILHDTQSIHHNFHYSHNLDTTILPLPSLLHWFISTLHTLFTTHSASIGSLSFDKDDSLAMDFVTAAANLRMINYHISPLLSRFTAKGIAGNIVHAIASTNAIAAGMIVQSTLEYLSNQWDKCQNVFISRNSPLLSGETLAPPRSSCYICGNKMVTIECNTSTLTLKSFYEKLLMGKLSFSDPSIDVYSADNFIGTKSDVEEREEEQEEEEGDEGDNDGGKKSKLFSLPIHSPPIGMKNGAQIRVEDQTQNLTVNLLIKHREDIKEEDAPEGFIISGGDIPVAKSDDNDNDDETKEEKKSSSSSSSSSVSIDYENDDVVDIIQKSSEPKSRKRKADDDESQPKKLKGEKGKSVVREDDGDGDDDDHDVVIELD